MDFDPRPFYIGLVVIVLGGIFMIAMFGVAMLGMGGGGSGENPGGDTAATAQTAGGATSGDLTTSLAGFDKNKVIEDSDFTNTSTMTTEQIQQFLTSRKSVLASYSENNKSAAQIVSESAQKYSINPQVILVVLQKEQSLLDKNTNNLDRRLRKAMGAACFDDGTCDVRTFGFSRQVDSGTAILRRWYDRASTGSDKVWHIGDTFNFDGQSVTFGSNATISLYKYTPHIIPDKSNFYRYFKDYFLKNAG